MSRALFRLQNVCALEPFLYFSMNVQSYNLHTHITHIQSIYSGFSERVTLYMPKAGFDPPKQREDFTVHMLYLQATTAGYNCVSLCKEIKIIEGGQKICLIKRNCFNPRIKHFYFIVAFTIGLFSWTCKNYL